LDPEANHSQSALPAHVAVIMDGNGRWAELRGRDRTFGHLKGARVAKKLIESCVHLKIPHLTLYAFSTENWQRPEVEVSFLMLLLSRHMRRERKTLIQNNIRFAVIGDLARLPASVRNEVLATMAETEKNTGMVLTFALSYGGRQEITAAVRAIADDVKNGLLDPNSISDELIQRRLQSSFLPDPDLIIRTSGEFRLSNFMLWQSAYSELYITGTLWPDFSEAELLTAFKQFSQRERRFGKVSNKTILANVTRLNPERTFELGLRDLVSSTATRQPANS
jgi:undecaprenyl diphosphate synthase